MTKTVIIAEDHPFIAEGMEAALESAPELSVAGIASNGIDAISMIKRLKPHCAVLDLSMPGANGLEVYLESKKWSPETKFAIVTGISAASLCKQLYDAGIDGLFFKNASSATIRNGIIAVANGRRVISPDAKAVIEEQKNQQKLSNRELEVLQCLARGQNNREIAKNLGVSHKTINSHRTNLLRKMNVNSTASLLVTAMRNGLINV